VTVPILGAVSASTAFSVKAEYTADEIGTLQIKLVYLLKPFKRGIM